MERFRAFVLPENVQMMRVFRNSGYELGRTVEDGVYTVDFPVAYTEGARSAAEFRETVLTYMRDHAVGGELTAVREGRVYRGGYLNQGPIHNLFLTERAAKQLYPEEFGEVTGDAELFDRGRVADIVAGEF